MLSDLFVLAALILVNALLAAAEIALLSVNGNRVKQRADEGDKKSILLKKLLDDPSKFLSAIQIGISLAGLFSGAFAASEFAEPLAVLLNGAGVPLSVSTLTTVSTIVITVTLSYFSLVFGELLPKRIAMKKSDSVAYAAVRPLRLLSAFVSPFVRILTASTNFALKLVGLDAKEDEGEVTEAEIRLMVDVGGDSGAIDSDEREMINNIFEFDNKTAEDVSVHRKDIVALPLDASEDEIISAVLSGKYSRIPVYGENIDDIIGVLYAKDVFRAYVNDGKESIDLRQMVREPYQVPTSKKANELFSDMRKNKVHLAIVIDEYGGTAGIVSMEDLIEEVMGDILDEYDDEEKPEIQAIDESTFLVDGQADLSYASAFFDTELPTDDYETIGGFVIGQLGRIPEDGERPETEFEGLVFKVESVSEHRINVVKVIKTGRETLGLRPNPHFLS
ncbi:hypothetical protein FACS189490_13320 [Clostridia bacterium]|nr:hypothetical protein FACS189490_13320 [Clostridia bacterium]